MIIIALAVIIPTLLAGGLIGAVAVASGRRIHNPKFKKINKLADITVECLNGEFDKLK